MKLKDLIPEQLYYIQVRGVEGYYKDWNCGVADTLQEAHQFTGTDILKYFGGRTRFPVDLSVDFIPVTTIQPEDIPY